MLAGLGGQNEGYKSKTCVCGWLGLSGVAPDWGRGSEMIGPGFGKLRPKGQISFQISGFGMSDERDRGRSD